MNRYVAKLTQSFIDLVSHATGYTVVREDQMVQCIKIHCRPNDMQRRKGKDQYLDGYAQAISKSDTAAQINDLGATGGENFVSRYPNPMSKAAGKRSQL